MNIQHRVTDALALAWDAHESGSQLETTVPPTIDLAIDQILANSSPPNRQYLLTIAAGTAEEPQSNPASLQLPAGVDRRGQAFGTREALSAFKTELGLTLKISQDAGVSNQWREVEITTSWAAGRRKQDQTWAGAFLTIVNWLTEVKGEARGRRAEGILQSTAIKIVAIAVGSALDYPRFRATPRLAMQLVRRFIETAPDRPDATEAIVAVAARSLTSTLENPPMVTRSDINSPDPIDVVMRTQDGEVNAGIEITDEQITLGKLEHEVVPAMLKLGLDRATVVSRGVASSEASSIEAFVIRAHTHFEQRIDLVTVDVVEAWLTFPGTPRDIATDFLWTVGEELDAYSNNGNRRAWFDVLTDYASSIESAL